MVDAGQVLVDGGGGFSPAPTAETTLCGPVAASPPLNTQSTEVLPVELSVVIQPRLFATGTLPGPRQSSGTGRCANHLITLDEVVGFELGTERRRPLESNSPIAMDVQTRL